MVLSAHLDCHLMMEHPELWSRRMIEAGASSLTFHLEATADPLHAVALLRRDFLAVRGTRGHVGVALKPATPCALLTDALLAACDMVLVMTVEPGFGGQRLLPHCIDKVRELRTARAFSGHIQVDGGVDADNAPALLAAGATVLVAGSSIFNAPDPKAAVRRLRGDTA